MDIKRYVLTKSGHEKLVRELNNLRTDGSELIAERLGEVREDDNGDEAFFFDTMVAKQRLDGRIAEIEYILANADIIEDDVDPEVVTPGNRVTVYDMDEKEEVIFDILGSAEIAGGRKGVSIESPVGKAMLGGRVGDKVEVEVPMGTVRYKVRKIEMIPDDEE